MDVFLDTLRRMTPFKVKRISENCILPQRMSRQAAGYDLFACTDKPIVIKPFQRALISTGFCMELPRETEAQIRPRSGLAFKHGVTVLNSPGTIDSDYRGEVKVMLVNLGTDDFEITNSMRIAQMVIVDVVPKDYIEVDELSETERGTGGFGSTGID